MPSAQYGSKLIAVNFCKKIICYYVTSHVNKLEIVVKQINYNIHILKVTTSNDYLLETLLFLDTLIVLETTKLIP